MRKVSIFIFVALLLAPVVLHATDGSESGIAVEAIPQDVTGTWSAINSGLTNTQVYTLVIDRTNPSIIYAGTNGGVFKSTDWGENWSAITSGLTNTHVRALAVDPSNPSTLYAGTEGGVFESADGGGGWFPVNSGLTDIRVWALVIDPSNPSTLYAGTASGVFKSVDRGGNWSHLGLPYAISALAIDPVSTSILYAMTENAGIYKSTNGGQSWLPLITNLACLLGYALAIDPSDPNVLYAGGACAVFKSTNGGERWIAVLPTTYGLALTVDPTDSNIVYAGSWGLGVFKSTDAGATWNEINSDLTNHFVTVLALDPTNASIMYAGTWGGVFKSFPAGFLSLYVSKSGTGDGGVTSDPPGIDCGSTCIASYEQGTSVTLTATPSSGSVFSGWSGACSGTGDCIVTMDNNRSATAIFNLPGQLDVYISIAPGSLNFGAVNVEQFSKQTITITNQADSMGALIGSVEVPPAPFSIVSGAGAFNLAPGESVAVTVQFSPATTGAASASLSILHNASNQPSPVDVSLSGMGVSGISVNPATKDYGTVKVNRSKTASFKVTNTGKGDLHILYSQIKGPDGSMFTITGGRGSKTLGPRKSLTIRVAFKPASAGPKSAVLEITSNDSTTPTLEIPLSGIGQ